jgi:ABC-type Mn2+/Zn2+ transport system permease subunit
MIFTSAATAGAAAVGGLMLSCLLDFPTGATMVLLLSLFYLLTIAVPWLRSRRGGA